MDKNNEQIESILKEHPNAIIHEQIDWNTPFVKRTEELLATNCRPLYPLMAAVRKGEDTTALDKQTFKEILVRRLDSYLRELTSNDKLYFCKRYNLLRLTSEELDTFIRIKIAEMEYYNFKDLKIKHKLSPRGLIKEKIKKTSKSIKKLKQNTVFKEESLHENYSSEEFMDSIIKKCANELKRLNDWMKEATDDSTIKLLSEELKNRPTPIKLTNFKNAVLYKHENDNKIIEYYVQNKYLEFLKSELKALDQPQQTEAVKPDEVYKTQNLFKVGKLFATGEMNKYFTVNNMNEIVLNNGLSPLKIAKELGNEGFEKIILASGNNYKTGGNKSKNIFNNLDMMTKIISDCEAKNIPVEPYFISRLPIE